MGMGLSSLVQPSVVPRPLRVCRLQYEVRLEDCIMRFCTNFVPQATNVQGLGTWLHSHMRVMYCTRVHKNGQLE